MDREYVDEELRHLASDSDFRPPAWSSEDIDGFRRLIQCVHAATVEDDLRNTRFLRIQASDHDDPARAQARLSSGRLIPLTFKGTDNHGTVVIGDLSALMEPPR
jgi:hypothetical protein